MGKKIKVTLDGIKIEFTCEKAGKQIVDVTEYDFLTSSNSCDLCGSHGEVTVDVKCACGSTHEIEIKSW